MKTLNKKSQTDISARKIIFYIIFGVLSSIVFLLIVFLVPASNSEISIIPDGLESYVLSQRFINSPECFAPIDEDSRRVRTSTIDVNKFTEQSINKCYDTKDSNVKGYRLTLKYDDKEKTITTKNWENFIFRAFTLNIRVLDNTILKEGSLFIEVQDEK